MEHQQEHNLTVRQSVTILKPAEELYRAWRSPETWGKFPSGVEAIEPIDERRSRWRIRVGGMGVKEWISEITEDREGQLIAWRTVNGSAFDHEGKVMFSPAPANFGTEVTLEVSTHMCGGRVANALAKLIRHSPEDYISMTLRNFKELMETGKVTPDERTLFGRVPATVTPRAAMAVMAAAVFATLFFLIRRQRTQ